MVRSIRLIGLIMALVALAGCQTAENPQPFSDLTPSQAEALIRSHLDDRRLVIVDVRTAGEFASGHLGGALNLDIQQADFADRINGLDKSFTYLVYCRGGVRSARAMKQMKQQGFAAVFNLRGGLREWQVEKRSLEIRLNGAATRR